MPALVGLFERLQATARDHPVWTDVVIAVAATMIVLALAPGIAMVGLVLIVAGSVAIAVIGVRRHAARRRQAIRRTHERPGTQRRPAGGQTQRVRS